MKARDVIAQTMSDWHEVDAPKQAQATFGLLDADEIIRLAQRAFTEEWRAELRVKDEHGVPKYASITTRDDNGSEVRLYKQTELFSIDDHRAVIAYHVNEARSHIRAARAIAGVAAEKFGVQLEIPSLDSGAA